MSNHPKARWSVSPASAGASVWTQEIPEGSGGGYYLYTWKRGSALITVEELAEGTTRDERCAGKRSAYVTVATIPVPVSVGRQDQRGQEIESARVMYADIRERFGEIAEWIECGTDGKPVWFHEKVTGR